MGSLLPMPKPDKTNYLPTTSLFQIQSNPRNTTKRRPAIPLGRDGQREKFWQDWY